MCLQSQYQRAGVRGLPQREDSLGYTVSATAAWFNYWHFLSQYQGQNKTETGSNDDLDLVHVFLDMMPNWALSVTK